MNRIIVNTRQSKGTINRNIYGHFSEHLGRCIYGGLYVDGTYNKAAVDALKAIKIPVLRWPGGCFADEYHWMDGVGPKSSRKTMVNTHWGGVTEDNSFGTHEFMEMCGLLGCEPYINGNIGSGTVREMSEWVEYITFGGVSPMSQLRKQNGHAEPWPLKYFGIGNENWGCGGNMRPEYYADEYRRYQTYVRNYGDNKIYKIACGACDFNYKWTEVLMERARCCMDALTLHYYTVTNTWQDKGSATEFTAEEYFTTLHKALVMDTLVANHSRVMDTYDPERRIGLIVDEWGTWHNTEPGTNPGFLYQQNTMRDALVAACTLNIFNNHCERVVMANLAQTVNVLQAVLLTEGDKVVKTPTYHVFDLYKEHQDAELLECLAETGLIGPENARVPNLHVSASRKDGRVHVTLANLSDSDACPVELFAGDAGRASARILSGSTGEYNDFSAPDRVRVVPFEQIGSQNGLVSFTLPACSVIAVTL